MTSLTTSAQDEIENIQLQKITRKLVLQFAKNLKTREKEILKLRLLSANPVTLEALGNKFNISMERVRQVERRLIEKLKKHILEQQPDIIKYINK